MSRALAFAAIALAGCGVGCDGDRGKRPEHPRADRGSATATGDTRAPVPDDERRATGYLDAAPGSLDALFRGLDAAERRDPSGRVLIAVFGDSHTAGDFMTSRLRSAWQGRFGDAGRGLVAAGRPTARHYYQRDVRYGASGIWKSAVGGTRDPEPFGVAGLRIYGEKQGAQVWVETCGDCKAGTRVGQFEILYHAAPDRGTLRYRIDGGGWQPLATKTTAIQPPHPARLVLPVPDGPHRLTIEHAGGGTIDLYGVAMERPGPGVIVDSLGVVGRRLGNLRSWDWSIIGEQLAARDPRLVVLQYGTNESEDPDLDLEVLAQYYDETIARIRAAAPGAAILILGPPDVATREGGSACDRPERTRRIEAGEPIAPECQWRTPGSIREIIAVEHAAAVRNRVAFFDTFAAMGGPDRMDGWFVNEPKFASKDRVHLTDLGYQLWADELSKALLGAYAGWRRAARLSPSPATSTAPAGAH